MLLHAASVPLPTKQAPSGTDSDPDTDTFRSLSDSFVHLTFGFVNSTRAFAMAARSRLMRALSDGSRLLSASVPIFSNRKATSSAASINLSIVFFMSSIRLRLALRALARGITVHVHLRECFPLAHVPGRALECFCTLACYRWPFLRVVRGPPFFRC
jgi:hypothetical protein